jgi:hypothetical protein
MDRRDAREDVIIESIRQECAFAKEYDGKVKMLWVHD